MSLNSYLIAIFISILIQILPNWEVLAQNVEGSYEHESIYDAGKVVYIVIVCVAAIIVLLCRLCIKYGCDNATENQQAPVVHPPPRRESNLRVRQSDRAVPVLTTVYLPTAPQLPASTSSYGRPPRTATRLIGVDNPGYQVHRPPDPMNDDLPPSYDSAVSNTAYPPPDYLHKR